MGEGKDSNDVFSGEGREETLYSLPSGGDLTSTSFFEINYRPKSRVHPPKVLSCSGYSNSVI